MSYSRWSNSVWYTYWSSTESEERNDQCFDICGVMSFTFEDLKDAGIDGMIDYIKKHVAKMQKDPDSMQFGGTEYTDEEWEELKGYIEQWVEDVKEECGTPSERYHAGEITLDEAFLGEV